MVDTKDTDSSSSKKSKDAKANVKINTYDKEYDFAIQSHTTGRQLFDQVAKILELKEVWFFGLQFTDTKGVSTWLKLKKKVFSQDVGRKRPINFNFRAKFYPEDVTKEVKDVATQRQFYYQCRELVLSGAVYCPPDTAVLLASYIAQANHGDYDPTIHMSGFLEEEKLLPTKVIDQYELTQNQWEDRIISFYRDHLGLTRSLACFEYVKVTHDLEMFGVNYFEIRNKKGTNLLLGVDALGLNVYEKENKLTPKLGFPWSEVASISFKDKKFTIIPVDELSPNFQFIVSKIRINKEILALCMGNHELYVRRRKDGLMAFDKSNTTHFVSNHPVESIIVQDGKLTPSASPTSPAPKDTGLPAPLQVPIVIPPTPEPSPKPSEPSPTMLDSSSHSQVGTQGESARPDSPVSLPPRDPSPDRQPSPKTQHENEESVSTIDVAKISDIDSDFSGSRSVSPQVPVPDYSPVKTPPESPTSVHHPGGVQPPAKGVSRYVFGTNINGNHLVDLSVEPETDLGSEYNANLSVSELSQQLLRQKEEDFQQRQPILEINEPTYKKLKNLFEELTGQEIDSSNEDRQHRKSRQEGLDKYKTLRGIQKGHTKHRVAIFEAL